MNSPDISVIIPVYNAEDFLRECLDSVLAQPGVEMEVICVNDGSTDNSLRILEEYQDKDARVRLIDQENRGQSVARNVAIAVARGRYICFLDSDDYWQAGLLFHLIKLADAKALDVLLFNAHAVREPGVDEGFWKKYVDYYRRPTEYSAITTGAELAATMRANQDHRPSPCLYLARRSLVSEAGLRFIPGIIHEDNPFTFELLLVAQRASHTQVALYARRVRQGSIMSSSADAASYRGYLLSYVRMSQLLEDRIDDEQVGRQLAAIVQQVLIHAKTAYMKLPWPEAEAAIAEFAALPTAMLPALILRRERVMQQQWAKRAKTAERELRKTLAEVKRLKRQVAIQQNPLTFRRRVRRKLGVIARRIGIRRPAAVQTPR